MGHCQNIDENAKPKLYYFYQNCIVKKNNCYKMLKCLDSIGRYTWASEFKSLFYHYRLGHVWLSQYLGDAEVFIYNFK